MSELQSVAIVTGGSRGIGRACALKLAAAGHLVVVNYVSNRQAADAVVADIAAACGRAVAVAGDVAKEADIVALFAAADRLGPLKVLVNNAGIMDVMARVDETSGERLARILTTNVTGTFLCAREAVKRMSTKHGGTGGAIINLSSAAAVHGAPGQGVDYATSKGAVDVLTIGLGREVAAEGVRVNAVRPGIIDTDIHATAGMPGRARQMAGAIPIQRAGTAEEVADAIVYLASPQASYITGAILAVAGGRC